MVMFSASPIDRRLFLLGAAAPDTPIPPNVLPAIYALNGTFHVVALAIPTVK